MLKMLDLAGLLQDVSERGATLTSKMWQTIMSMCCADAELCPALTVLDDRFQPLHVHTHANTPARVQLEGRCTTWAFACIFHRISITVNSGPCYRGFVGENPFFLFFSGECCLGLFSVTQAASQQPPRCI
jgi:hypothetical protein